jgi:hypothetical protein
VLFIGACGQSAPPAPTQGSLGADVVARVGDETIPRELVASVAAARGITARAALEDLLADALLAAGAQGAGAETKPEVAWAIETARARQVTNRVRASAVALGKPTDEEVAELTARNWQAFDLPERVRVIHAVVRYPTNRSPQADARAHAVFVAMAQAVAGAPDAATFEERAKAVPHEKVSVVVESLPALAADGRSTEGERGFDPTFAAAAFSLTKPGAQAKVESPYGWHVIFLVERLPPKSVPFEERRVAFAEEALQMRARKEYDALLRELRARYPVEVSSAAENLMKPLSLAP